MFKITNHKGFQITFKNGWTVSVQWGPGNYCEHYESLHTVEDYKKPAYSDFWSSQTAEIAAWDHNNKWYDFPEGDQVKGHQTAQEVLEFMKMIEGKSFVKE